MSGDEPNDPLENPASPSVPHFSPLGAHVGQLDGRTSFDSDRSSAPSPPMNGNNTNGVVNGRKHTVEADSDPVEKLQLQLERTMEEKEALAAQYRTLLAKLTTMRTSLGNKLKQDAVCLCIGNIVNSTTC